MRHKHLQLRKPFSAIPGTHEPGILENLPPVMGSMLEFQNTKGEMKFRLYITGDTLIDENLKQIPQRYPDIDLALLHLGGTKDFGIIGTMAAKQGDRQSRLLPHVQQY